jgi:UDP-2-acetamido-3-amino-2,3-dideoxy-glucuronate N-acetyltransferase
VGQEAQVERWIDPSARIGEGTELGQGVVVEAGVVIGRGCLIGHHVVVRADSVIGEETRLDDFAVIGKTPLRARNSILKAVVDLRPARLGRGMLVGTAGTVYRGAELGEGVLLADQATVRERVVVGDFTIIGRGVVVENDCRVGRYCKLETECYITAYSTLEDRVFVAPQVTTSNDRFIGRTEERFKHFRGVTVRKGGRIGAGAVILPGLTIGEDALVAAGSVLTRDVPPRMIFLGSPAKPLRPVPEEQLLDRQNWPE